MILCVRCDKMVLSQIETELSTALFFILSFSLAYMLTTKYTQTKQGRFLFWALGMWAFFIGDVLEFVFATGIYSVFLADIYLFAIAILPGLLAIGSMQYVKSGLVRRGYYIFNMLAAVLLLYYLATENVGNMMVSYVVAGMPPMDVINASTIITVPATIVIVVAALLSYRRKKDIWLLSIVVGILGFAIAGSLYALNVAPLLLYYAEFVGLIFLWAGFYKSTYR